jgi:uncharacterized membrane protein YeaQ/YmgE (transglycosylase-associated protein family)
MEKLIIYIGITIGGLVGAYIPSLIFQIYSFSALSIICGSVGSIVGLFVGYKIQQNMD